VRVGDAPARARRDGGQLRARVAAAARRVAAAGLVHGTSGNVSQRDGAVVAITPSGAALEGLDGEQVTLVDLDGAQLEGGLPPSSELDLHLGVYRRYQAGAVVHAHSVAATALSCVLDELPVVHYNMLALGGAVRVARYETFGTRELAEATLEALQDRTAALLANHGTVVYAADVEQAVERALLLEWCCEVYWRAAQLDRPRTLTAEQLRAVAEQAALRGYGTLGR
jgi:L-fuculose-phosphate aldolase